ncbi:hypothetical protein PIROE2DRAFT_16519 [Piromyces sp. E2]|nr:hypothetical protein PIROE2DRAFT_16519 [Piromyces sp. E2]|eukprot:OUM58249.1 hypothetical protein PIROE2DRAFT_16519 [Piromyces sp. E2]
MSFIDKIKNNKYLLGIIIVFIVEVVTVIFRHIKYISFYDYEICNYLHYSLKDDKGNMTDKSYEALSKISREFPEHYDNAGLGFMIDEGISALTMIFSIIFLLISVSSLYCRIKGCIMCFNIFTLFYCVISNSIYLRQKSLTPTISLAVTSVPVEDIDAAILNMKLYDKTLQEHLDYYYYGRKTWLKICPVAILLECLLQIFLVIKYNNSKIESVNKKELINSSDFSFPSSSQV